MVNYSAIWQLAMNMEMKMDKPEARVKHRYIKSTKPYGITETIGAQSPR